jgi:endonuclease/exonuclease/phosphatase family metal-dependent hydrolase
MINPSLTENFYEPDAPRFQGRHAGDPPAFSNELTVVSWNIKLALKLETAISELRTAIEQHGADIILLQEMDEVGIEAISRALAYNYVYYPASVHCKTGEKFGNAILSVWPMTLSKKVILPNRSPRTREIRVATRARISVGDSQLLAYSVHTETMALNWIKRQEQFQFLADDIARQDVRHVILGGDFNTITRKNIGVLDAICATASLERTSAGAEPTMKAGGLGLSLDHIYTRGLTAIDKGTGPATRASDHLQVWEKLVLDPQT